MTGDAWRPDASIDVLRNRAGWLKRIREFFEQRNVLEVETPVLSDASAPDPNIESLQTRFHDRVFYLQTSPELYMKRLLAAGSGPIWQLSRVFRDHEFGRLHNPEFSMIEWYRPGYGMHQLMQEVAELVNRLCASRKDVMTPQFMTYRSLFMKGTGLDPLHADWDGLHDYIGTLESLQPPELEDWSVAMDWLLSTQIQPSMKGMVFVHDYPAQQAALARIDPHDPSIARRFELFIDGIEMANGFEELTDADEQQSRFERENAERLHKDRQQIAVDQKFLDALGSGMPESSGVALGLDRLLMWATGASTVREVMAFGWPR